jgi:DnaJ-class molecular chaperone
VYTTHTVAVVCKVCDGTGKINQHQYNPEEFPEATTCYECLGRGWVEVGRNGGR